MRILPGLAASALLTATVIAGATTAASSATAAPDAVAKAGNGDAVVARVGTAAITVADLERRLTRIRRNRLRAFGATPEEVRRNVLVTVLIPEVLYTQEAESRGLASSAHVRDQMQTILREAVQNEFREALRQPGAVTSEEVRAYYEENLTNFQTPERVQIWRILVDTENEANAILAEAKADHSVQRWRELARRPRPWRPEPWR